MREVKPKHNRVGPLSLVDRMTQPFFKAITFKLGFIGRTAISTEKTTKKYYQAKT